MELKQQNPNFPILIRECSGVEPRVYGRYGEAVHVSCVYQRVCVCVGLVFKRCAVQWCMADLWSLSPNNL